jgi:hypothetical protein
VENQRDYKTIAMGVKIINGIGHPLTALYSIEIL